MATEGEESKDVDMADAPAEGDVSVSGRRTRTIADDRADDETRRCGGYQDGTWQQIQSPPRSRLSLSRAES